MNKNPNPVKALKDTATAVYLIGFIVGLCMIVLWPLMIVTWMFSFMIGKLFDTQSMILAKLETIEDKLDPKPAEPEQTETITE